MALDANIVGGVTGNKAEVDNFGNSNVTLPGPGKLSQTGYAALAAINHDGAAGAGALIRPAEISVNRRLRVGTDSLMFQETFNYTAQNTAVWAYNLTTMTTAHTGGFLVLNAGNSVASGAVARASSYKFMPLYNGVGLAIEMDIMVSSLAQTNNVIEFGLMQASGTSAPTDGFFFRVTAGGVFQGVSNYGGAETTVTLNGGILPNVSVCHSFLIRVEQEEASFWVDNILYGTIVTPVGQNGLSLSSYQPITFRIYNAAAITIAQQLRIGEVRVFIRDLNVNRSWQQTMAAMGQMGPQGQSGTTMGSTALYGNSANPTAAVPTNTTAALGVGLGGTFWHTNTLAVNTDGIISSFQVPNGTAIISGRALIITGVKISTGVQTTLANAAGALYQWSLGFGNTNVSLANTESANTKSSRRIPLGIQGAVGALVQGTTLTDIVMTFASPIAVNPGEFVQTVVRNIGTVGTGGVLAHTVTFDAHWE